MIALDTNLLIYAHRKQLSEHDAARRAIEEASMFEGGWSIPSPCLAEFWKVVTHPANGAARTAPHQARAYLQALQDAGAKILYPRDGLWQRLARAAVALEVQGPRIFDLQIAQLAKDAGATQLWTHDAGFLSVPGLRVVHPLR
jgi:toxin-antitoxin system PIN domain toxin